MIHLQRILADPQALRTALMWRGADPSIVDAIIPRAADLKEARTRVDALNAERRAVSDAFRLMGEAEREQARVRLASQKALLALAEAAKARAEAWIADALLTLPNIAQIDVPQGTDESCNVVLSTHGEPRRPAEGETLLDHAAIGERLGMLDVPTAVAMSGTRFALTKGGLARLERALGQFMLDLHVDAHALTEISTPLLVHEKALVGTGQLPKFADDLFSAGDLYLIPTAEVPLTNMARDDQMLDLLSRGAGRYVALTPCFRAEAGAAGRDTRGLIRQHQFHKVEMVTLTTQDQALEELKRMVRCATKVLDQLHLAYRIVKLCTGDLGFSSQVTYDIEVWMAGEQRYREISSISYCGDFQARRMGARYRDAQGAMQFIHTLNGSGVATGRALAAVMETWQVKGGEVQVPEELIGYMGGASFIRRAA